MFSIRSGHTRLALQMVGKEAKIPINYTGGREKSRKEISSKEQKRGEWESKLGNWEEGGRKFRQKNKKLGGGWESKLGNSMHGRSAGRRINAAGDVRGLLLRGESDAL